MRNGMKRLFAAVSAAAICLTALAGCGGGASDSNAPENLAFSVADGSFSFDTVKNAETYTVGVSKILNDTTGQALEKINGAVATEIAEGESVYLWSEQTGSVAGLADTDGDGTVDGTVVFREYSSSASTVGQVISMDQLPLGHYVVTAIASSNDKLLNPESAYYRFTKGGTLTEPAGFTAEINANGNMEITAPSSYYLNCLTATGQPDKMRFEIMDGSTVVETIELDDFSYTNSVNGPNKAFSFNNQTVTGTETLDTGKAYSVVVTAVGDGDQILDASAEAYVASSTSPVSFASEYEISSSGTAGDYSVSLTLGLDSTGVAIYELTASVNSVVILRESGTYTASEEAGTFEDKNTYPDGTTVTFVSDVSDFDAPVLDGVTLTAVQGEEQVFGPPGTASGGADFYLEGSASLNGTSFDFGQSSGGGFPGGPM